MRLWIGPWVWSTVFAPAHWAMPVGAVQSLDLRSLPACGTPVAVSGSGLFVTPDSVALDAAYREVPATLGPAARSAIETALEVRAIKAATREQLVVDLLTTHAVADGSSFVRPLMPDRRGRLSLRFGGADFTHALDPSSPHFAKVAQVFQDDYRHHQQRAERGEASPDFHRKWMGAVLQSLKVDHRLLIPKDLKVEDPLPPSTTLTESFDKSSAATLGPDQTWQEYLDGATSTATFAVVLNAACGVNSTEALGGGLATARAEADLSGTNHSAQITVVSLAAGGQNGQLGAAARFSSSANTCYATRALRIVDKADLVKIVAGTLTDLSGGGVAITISLPQDSKVECNGSTIKAFYAGVEKVSLTDTAITTGTRCGVYGYASTASGANVYGDSWVATDLSASGDLLLRLMGEGLFVGGAH